MFKIMVKIKVFYLKCYKLDQETWLCRTHLDDSFVKVYTILDHITLDNILSYLNLLDLFKPIWFSLDMFVTVWTCIDPI